jgi:hypothetical protein
MVGPLCIEQSFPYRLHFKPEKYNRYLDSGQGPTYWKPSHKYLSVDAGRETYGPFNPEVVLKLLKTF